MLDLNLLRTFAKVAELGSFTKAADYLKQPKSRVSRAISRLEADLNTQLIKRTTRQTNLTEAGKELFIKTNDLLSQLYSEMDNISQEPHELSGNIKITGPEDFCMLVLPPIINEFSEQHPNVTFNIISSNNRIDFTANDIDVAFRIGTPQDSSLIYKKIGSVKSGFAASPKYLSKYGVPKKVEELKDHKVLSFVNQYNKDLLDSLYAKFSTDKKFRPDIVCNSFYILRDFAIEGKGIALLPDFYSKPALSEGKLVRVLPEWNTSDATIQLLYAPTKSMPKRLREFIDFVIEKTQFLND